MICSDLEYGLDNDEMKVLRAENAKLKKQLDQALSKIKQLQGQTQKGKYKPKKDVEWVEEVEFDELVENADDDVNDIYDII